jgi:4a-hydroxytetrahydrobiopterin dehydratase
MATLTDAQVAQRLADAEQWRRGEGSSPSGKDAIARDFAFANFTEAITFVNRVADAAELANHHPDILVHGWNKVRLTLSTHSAGGLTDADFQLAAQIDRLA